MDGRLQLKLAMLARLQDFLRAYPLGDGPVGDVVAQFTEKMGRLRALMAQQQDGELAREAETGKHKMLRHKLSQLPLRHLARIASSLADEHAEVAATLGQDMRNISGERFIAAAQSVATTIQAQHDLLRSHGMAEGTLENLTGLLQEYAQAVQDANTARRAHIGARAQMFQLGAELMRHARQLDGIVVYQFHENAELLATWKSARNIAWPAAEAPRVPAAQLLLPKEGQPSR